MILYMQEKSSHSSFTQLQVKSTAVELIEKQKNISTYKKEKSIQLRSYTISDIFGNSDLDLWQLKLPLKNKTKKNYHILKR